jgi:hypothetical protein
MSPDSYQASAKCIRVAGASQSNNANLQQHAVRIRAHAQASSVSGSQESTKRKKQGEPTITVS